MRNLRRQAAAFLMNLKRCDGGRQISRQPLERLCLEMRKSNRTRAYNNSHIHWFANLCTCCACSPHTNMLALLLLPKVERPAARHDCPGRNYPVESDQQPPPVRFVSEHHPGLRAGSSISVLQSGPFRDRLTYDTR